KLLVRHTARDRSQHTILSALLRLLQSIGRCTKHSPRVTRTQGSRSEVIKRGGKQARLLGTIHVEVAADSLQIHNVGLGWLFEPQNDERASLPRMRAGLIRHNLDRCLAHLTSGDQPLELSTHDRRATHHPPDHSLIQNRPKLRPVSALQYLLARHPHLNSPIHLLVAKLGRVPPHKSSCIV